MDKIEKLMEELGLDKCIPYEIKQDEFLLGICYERIGRCRNF